MIKNTKIDIVILCGGKGTRFQEVSSHTPKALADIHGKPFLDILLDHYLNLGFERFILCTGFLSHRIKQYYSNSKYKQYVNFSEEPFPLGTGGAIKNAKPFIESDDFIVLNGDSFCDIDYKEFLEFHFNKTKARVTIALTKTDERTDTGSIGIDEKTSLITEFHEKILQSAYPYINAGVYVFDKNVLDMIPDNQNYSLEHALFPELANKGLYGFISNKKLIDIGTKDRYEKALQFFTS